MINIFISLDFPGLSIDENILVSLYNILGSYTVFRDKDKIKLWNQ